VLILAAILAIFVYGLIAPILGALLPTYGLTAGQQGMLAMLYAIGLIIASLSAGPVIDLKGNKLALLFGLILIIASLVAAPNAGGYGGLLVVYLVLGLGGGVVVTGANALVGAIEPTRRGSALNFLNLFFHICSIRAHRSGHGLLRNCRTDRACICDKRHDENAGTVRRSEFPAERSPGTVIQARADSAFIFPVPLCGMRGWCMELAEGLPGWR
jgi:fucose permease